VFKGVLRDVQALKKEIGGLTQTEVDRAFSGLWERLVAVLGTPARRGLLLKLTHIMPKQVVARYQALARQVCGGGAANTALPSATNANVNATAASSVRPPASFKSRLKAAFSAADWRTLQELVRQLKGVRVSGVDIHANAVSGRVDAMLEALLRLFLEKAGEGGPGLAEEFATLLGKNQTLVRSYHDKRRLLLNRMLT
jgi:hypothetical protein